MGQIRLPTSLPKGEADPLFGFRVASLQQCSSAGYPYRCESRLVPHLMPRKRELCQAGDLRREQKRAKVDRIPDCFTPSAVHTHELSCPFASTPCGEIKVSNNLHRWAAFSSKLQETAASRREDRTDWTSLNIVCEKADPLCPGCLLSVQPAQSVQGVQVFVGSCQRTFETLSEAVRHSSPHETIVLEPGVYVEQESVVLDKPGLTIKARIIDDESKTRNVHIVSHTLEQHCFVIRADGCCVVGLDVLHMACHEEAESSKRGVTPSTSVPPLNKTGHRGCFSIESGDGRVERCSITSVWGYGLMVWAAASPLVADCSIQHCGQAAVICGGNSRGVFQRNSLAYNKSFGFVVVDEAAGVFEENEVHHTTKCGVLCAGASTASFRGNTVADGSQGGVWIRNSSQVELVGNRIRGNAKAGLQVGDEANPRVENNVLENGRNGGVVIHGSARGVLVGNVLSGHAQAGVGVLDKARPVLIGNTLLHNNAGGAILAGESLSVWVRNTVAHNAVVGIGLKEHAEARFGDGVIEHNGGNGALLQAECSLELHSCRLEGNAKAQIIAAGRSRLGVRECVLEAGAGGKGCCVGIQGVEEAAVEVEGSAVRGHAGGNLVLEEQAAAEVRRSTLTDSAAVGVLLRGKSRARLARSSLLSNGTGLLATEAAEWGASDCSVGESRGVGVVAAGASRGWMERAECSRNGAKGLVARGGAEVTVSACRFSWNGGEGVVLDEGCRGEVTGSCVFENAGYGMFVGGTAEVHAHDNVLAAGSGGGPGCLAARIEGLSRGRVAGNVVDSFELDEARGCGVAFEDNTVSGEAQVRARVREALDSGRVGPRAEGGLVGVLVGGTLCLGVRDGPCE